MNDIRASIWGRNHPRLCGAVLTLVGGGVAYLVYHWIIDEAQEGRQSISFPGAGFAMLVAFSCIGMFLLIGGRGAMEAADKVHKGPAIGRYVVAGLFVVPGIAAYLWLNHQLAALGYQ